MVLRSLFNELRRTKEKTRENEKWTCQRKEVKNNKFYYFCSVFSATAVMGVGHLLAFLLLAAKGSALLETYNLPLSCDLKVE